MKKPAATACFVILCSALLGAAVHASPVQEAGAHPEPDRVIEIVAERFLFTPSQITIEADTTVEFRLSSEDTDHRFRLVGPDGTDVDIDVTIPKRNRGEASAFFAPTEPGKYRFECSRICGAGHTYMRGVIRVTGAALSEPATQGGSR